MIISRKSTTFVQVLISVIAVLVAGCTQRQNPADSPVSSVGGNSFQVMHFPALEHNPLGDSPARIVSVAFASDTTLAVPQPPFPVLYLLHDFGGDVTYFERYNLQGILNEMYRNGEIGRMLVVTVDASNAFNGSYYRNSTSSGNYEDLLQQVINLVEQNYRVYTQAGPKARAISGHGMGGYGALRFAMDHPGLFGSVSSMSGPVSLFGADGNTGVLTWAPKILAENSVTAGNAASFKDIYPAVGKPFTNNMIAMASAFSPRNLERIVSVDSIAGCLYCPGTFCPDSTFLVLCKPCTVFETIPEGSTTIAFPPGITEAWVCFDKIPKKPALLGVDLPFDANAGRFDSVSSQWLESDIKTSFVGTPHALDDVDVYFDCGVDDEWGYLEQNDALDQAMKDAGKAHIYEKYTGFEGVPAGHTQLILERLRKVIKFHSDRLLRAPGPDSH